MRMSVSLTHEESLKHPLTVVCSFSCINSSISNTSPCTTVFSIFVSHKSVCRRQGRSVSYKSCVCVCMRVCIPCVYSMTFCNAIYNFLQNESKLNTAIREYLIVHVEGPLHQRIIILYAWCSCIDIMEFIRKF